jgi:DNA primase
MLNSSDIEMVKDAVTMRDLAEYYGFEVRHMFIRCPFHGEKTGSLKIYSGKGGWHCFGCGLGGDIIDFAMKYEDIDFTTAVQHVGAYFNIPISDGYKPTKEEKIAMEQHKEKQLMAIKERQRRTEEMIAVSEQIRLLEDIQQHLVPLGHAFCELQQVLMKLKTKWDEIYESADKDGGKS